jgi:hypothetical protein
MRLPTILALAMLLAVCPRTSVRAQDDDDSYEAPSDDEGAPPQPYGDDSAPPPDEGTYRDAPDPADYDEALAPNGEWVEEPEYGRVWRPAVAVDWRPYSAGYWAWTPYGWTWISSEPWGWTFHYGHWVLGGPGWVWVPGTIWGPAYVDWVWHDGYIGWAPLPPVGHVVVVNNFVFVHERHFCDRRIGRVIERHPPRGWGHGDWHRYRVRSPEVHRVARVAREPVHRVQGKPPETIAPSRRNKFNHGPGMRTPGGEHGQQNRQQQDRPQRGTQGQPNHPQRNRQDQPGDDRPDRQRANSQDRPQHERAQQNRPQPEQHDRLPREQQNRPQADRPERDGTWRGGHADRPSPQLRGEQRQQQRQAHPQSQRPVANPESFGSPQPSQMAPRNAQQTGPSGEGHERRGGHHGEGMNHPSGGPQRRGND